jgi:hypothetical protein
MKRFAIRWRIGGPSRSLRHIGAFAAGSVNPYSQASGVPAVREYCMLRCAPEDPSLFVRPFGGTGMGYGAFAGRPDELAVFLEHA